LIVPTPGRNAALDPAQLAFGNVISEVFRMFQIKLRTCRASCGYRSKGKRTHKDEPSTCAALVKRWKFIRMDGLRRSLPVTAWIETMQQDWKML
jgi:hypothetical protein